ncbi:MAG TPA: DNA repair protein RecO [Burkholderiales bacterium]|nr:DNA repair protein RecO [Burkholderiales bacterium]
MSKAGNQASRQELGFVLHAYPFRETSLVVEIFTRGSGRLAMVARGARRASSILRGHLMAFQPLLLSWGGKSELRTLYRSEWQGGMAQLRGLGLICGFYLNELLLRFLLREDPHETLFDTYRESIAALAGSGDYAATLRRFEKNLLREMGYALALEREADTDVPIDPARLYAYVIERGPVPMEKARDPAIEVRGKTLLDLACDNYSDPVTLQQGKILMRQLVAHYLGSRTLHTRQLLLDLQQL